MAKTTRNSIHSALCLGFALALQSGANAAVTDPTGITDIASYPISSQVQADVKPNIMLVLDDSGSMGLNYMPDTVGANTALVGFANSSCNTIYYNPSINYVVPQDGSGAAVNASVPTQFSAAYLDGFYSFDNALAGTLDLGTSFVSGNSVTGAANYWVYSGSNTLIPGSGDCALPSTNANPGRVITATTTGICSNGDRIPDDVLSSCQTGSTKVWSKVVVSATSGPVSAPDERQNFANWYSYYSTRLLMIKSASSRAFTPLIAKAHYRVGFITINPMTLDGITFDSSVKQYNASTPWNSKFLDIDDFTSASGQPNKWFNILFAQKTNYDTPLREALSRVGRYYGGKSDGINSGMIDSSHPDPVQYNCQQNYAILTTDGYWNIRDAAGTSAAGGRDGSGIKLDGSSMANPPYSGDSVIDEIDAWNTPAFYYMGKRPIYDGGLTSKVDVTTASNQWQLVSCTVPNGQLYQSTTQRLQSTAQTLQTITPQVPASVTMYNKSTVQNRQSTTQNKQSTTQVLQSTTQTLQSTAQTLQVVTQLVQTTQQTKQSTVQNLQSTTQTRQSTTQTLQSTTQILKSTVKNLQSTTQTRQSTTQTLQSTTQILQSTVQNRQSTVQNLASTSQIQKCNALGSGCIPAASCTPVVEQVTCKTVTTTNVPVASCTAAAASSANSYTTTTCPTPITTTNVPVATCTAAAASSGNSWTTTTCPTPVTTTNVPVASCTAAAASSANNYVTTTCPTPITTGPIGVASCTTAAASSSNNYVATTCTPNNTGPTGVASCTASGANAGNSYTATTCAANNTTNVAVATCTASGPTAANSYTTTTCPTPVTTTNVPAASCTATAASSGNSWTTTTCPTPVTTGPIGVASCTTAAASSSNNYVATTCTPNNTGPTGVASCTASGANAGNSYTATTCAANNTTNVAVATCTASGPTAANSYTTTTCPTPITTGPTAVATCTAAGPTAGNNYTTTTCVTTTLTGPIPVATCTPGTGGSPNFIQTLCATNTISSTPVATCTASGPTAPNYYTTTCVANNTGPTAVASCTASGPTAGNNYTTTTCTPNITASVPVASCTAAAASAANNYTTTTCPTPITTTNVPVASCTQAAASAANNYVKTTCSTTNTTNVAVASCTPSSPVSPNYITTTCSPLTTGPTLVTSCTAAAASSSNSYTTTTCPSVCVGGACNTTLTGSGPTPVATCTAATASSGNGYMATTCTTNSTNNQPVASCTAATASATNNYTTTTCPTPVTTGPTAVASCNAASASAANNYTTTTCTTGDLASQKRQYRTTTTTTTTNYSGNIPIGSPSTAPGITSAWTDFDATCPATAGTLPVSGDVGTGGPAAGQATNPTPQGFSSACASWPCQVSTSLASGSTNTLSDVSQYYYKTDLRTTNCTSAATGYDLCSNVVTGNGSGDPNKWELDQVNWQHMTTFTMGLGVSGTLNFDSNYTRTPSSSADFQAIRDGTKSWPVPPAAPLATDIGDPKTIDDLWHAGVDGRGQYFSASNPSAVINGLTTALTGVGGGTGAAAAAATSSLEPVTGDNFAYTATYTTQFWYGDLQGYQIDLNTGSVLTNAPPVWGASAATQLDGLVSTNSDTRTIWLFRKGATNNLVSFTPGTLSATELAFFQSKSGLLTQGTDAGTTAAQRTAMDNGANLVNFIRGQRGAEGWVGGDVTKLFRARTHVLGDIVNAQPRFVSSPKRNYNDPGYATFKANYTSPTPRTKMLYVGSNDGMLHAFYADSSATDPLIVGGKEAWSFIPTTSLDDLWKLADINYANMHTYFVDGTPTVGDVYDPNAGGCSATPESCWKTIIVGGLNAGGSGFYALDITNPATPKALWEFKCSGCYSYTTGATTDANLGLSFGNPIISKLADGTWVVLVTSGYNNTKGDGKGYLYAINAITGQLISSFPIGTGVGSPASPSGLGKINNWVNDFDHDNTTQRVYGGDLNGDIWRFDVNDTISPSGLEAALLGVAKDSLGNQQPITTLPELAEIGSPPAPFVYVATGRYFGFSDLSNTNVQSIYAVADPMTAAPSATSPIIADLRSALNQITLTTVGNGSSATRTASCTAPCSGTSGWYVDLPDSGERVTVDMKLLLGTLTVVSNVPRSDSCNVGGYSWLNSFDYATGKSVQTGGTVSNYASDSLVVGMTVFGLPNGKVIALLRDKKGENLPEPIPYEQTPATGRRISWRELIR